MRSATAQIARTRIVLNLVIIMSAYDSEMTMIEIARAEGYADFKMAISKVSQSEVYIEATVCLISGEWPTSQTIKMLVQRMGQPKERVMTSSTDAVMVASGEYPGERYTFSTRVSDEFEVKGFLMKTVSLYIYCN
jgi:hypothetical protein